MKNAELKVVLFDENDVIATSSYLLDGLGDGENGNIQFRDAHNTTEFKNKYGQDWFDGIDGNCLADNFDEDDPAGYGGYYVWFDDQYMSQ